MKVLRYLALILSIIFIDSVSMEEGASSAKPSSEPYKPASYIGGGKLGEKETKPLSQNIWTKIIEVGLINPFGKTEAEIFRITDLMMYPKKAKESSAEDSKCEAEIDLKKVQAQAGLRKAVKSWVDKIGAEKKIKNYSYKQFKADIMDGILRKKLGESYYSTKLLTTATNLKAYNWAKFYLTREDVARMLLKTSEPVVEFAFALGADPNMPCESMVSISDQFKPKPLPLMSPLFQLVFDFLCRRHSKYYIERIKLFLQHGADPLLELSSPIELSYHCNSPKKKSVLTPYDILKISSQYADSLMLYRMDRYDITELSAIEEIKKLFDEAIEKQKRDNN